MPELPEVQTTVNGLIETVVGLKITDVWSDYDSPYWKGSGNIKDKKYFDEFKKHIFNRKISGAKRRAKNILIQLDHKKNESPDTILIHMKMTGHIMYGRYDFDPKKKTPWMPIHPESLKDPFNRHIHFVITFNNGKRLALSDSRKFAKVTFIKAHELDSTIHLKNLGPEPLDPLFTYTDFKKRLFIRPSWNIKQTITDQAIIAGIGNIYADESLWRAGIHPQSLVSKIPEKNIKNLYEAIQSTLKKGIDFGGDSMSDYRNIHGEKGKFQEEHLAYRKTGKKCEKKGCKGIIQRISLGGRGTHFCGVHQKLFK